jgi:Arc/MetJ family transcription regulator
MRTNIVIDDKLLKEAQKLTNISTKKALVHEALRFLIAFKKRKPLSEIIGEVEFDSSYDYKASRSAK